MAPVYEIIIKLGMPINSYYMASGADLKKREKTLIPHCKKVLDELKKNVPLLKLAKGDDFEMTWISFHVFGEFVQLHFEAKEDLQVALDALLAFSKIDNGEQYGPYQTLMKLYLALDEDNNAYQLATNISRKFKGEDFLDDLLKSPGYKTWKKKKSA